MPQLSLYLDDGTAAAVKKHAKTRHESVSKYIADAIKTQMDSEWPEWFAGLYGSSECLFAEPEELSYDSDVKRDYELLP
jgi:hypothetical protein